MPDAGAQKRRERQRHGLDTDNGCGEGLDADQHRATHRDGRDNRIRPSPVGSLTGRSRPA